MALMSIFFASGWTRVYTGRPRNRHTARCYRAVCLCTPSFHWYLLHFSVVGWLGWVDPVNKMTKLANLVQFKRVFMSCLMDWR